jgi:hydroxyethylthiazole kinase-like uncharacterized protein yjeF
MTSVWPGSRIREAERAAVAEATSQGDPDRHMRLAAHALATTVLRRLSGAELPVAVEAARPRTGVGRPPGAVAGARVVIVVGPGGNGGDGLYAGAHLARRGVVVTAVPVTDTVQPRALAAYRSAGGRIVGPDAPQAARALAAADVVVDAGFGTGAKGGLPAALEAVWSSTAWIVAADAPSGLDTDTGRVIGSGFTPAADLTLTFGALKTGLFLGSGRSRSGAVALATIPGLLDPEVLARPDVDLFAAPEAHDSVLSPLPGDHKYSRGVLGLVAGSPAYPGAAVLASRAALSTGVGMLTAFSRGRAATLLSGAVPEAVVVDRADDRFTTTPQAAKAAAWLIGPGLGDEAQDLDAASEVLAASAGTPVVVDASALAVVPADSDGSPWILTPHAGELRALSSRLGLDLPDAVRDPLGAVRAAAAALRCVVLLKGSTTLVATPAGEVLAACSAGPELAVAGSGDTLSGILGSLVATHAARQRGAGQPGPSHHHLAHLAAAAAVIHGEAGSAAASTGRRGAEPLARALATVLGPA